MRHDEDCPCEHCTYAEIRAAAKLAVVAPIVGVLIVVTLWALLFVA